MRHVITFLLLFFVGQSISAQQEVTLDHVTNSTNGLYLIAGRTHVFNIRFRNFPPGACSTVGFGVSNGFVFSSPDGATWDHTIGTITEVFLNQPLIIAVVNNLNDRFGPRVPGDGISPDYVGMTAIEGGCLGLIRDGYDEIVLEIELVTDIADTNLHICIDKSEGENMGPWTWTGFCVEGCNVAPAWAGQQCFTINAECCVGRKGNIDLDPFGTVDIADLTFLIDHLFINFPELPCTDQANIDGDLEGKVDIADLTMLIDHLFINFPQLPFCQ